MTGTRFCAVLAAGALAAMVAGCGAIPGATTGGTPRNAGAYSACMRSHGVPDFPDAKSGGFNIDTSPGKTIANGVTLKETQAQFTAADQACNHYLGTPTNAGPASPAQQQAALAFARCMRAHGYPNFPDPKVTAHSFGVRVPAGVDANSPQFTAAMNTCQALAPTPVGPNGGEG